LQGLSREIAKAVRGSPTPPAAGLNQPLDRQIAELRQRTAHLQAILDNVKDAIVTVGNSGHIESFNPTGERIFGYAQTEIIDRTLDFLLPEIDSRGVAEFLDRLATKSEDTHVDLAAHQTWGRAKDGNRIGLEIAVSKATLHRREGYVVCIRDITERKKTETALFQAKERAQVTLQSIGDAVITTDSEARIDYLNPVAESLTGWSTREAAGRRIEEILGVVDEATREPSESPIVRCLREGQTRGLSQHTALLTRGAKEIAIQDSAAPIRDGAGNLIGAVMVFHDVSKERRLHRALHYQAIHDALTGLVNRREFENRVTAAVASVRSGADTRYSLLYLDLDRFKLVNDTCGHPAGDQLLKHITGVLQLRVRDADTLARLGGDEFGILLQGCGIDQATRIAETIRQAIRDFRFVWRDGVLRVGVSIGIVEITQDTLSVANVMSAADVACYTAKESGRNRTEVYKPEEVPERHREMHWVSRLTRACDESRFELYYQPIVPIGATVNEREHFELMLRLRDDAGHIIAPAEFIPAAERYNIMPAIDRWVVRHALEQVVHRNGLGLKPYTVAINLSGNSLNDEHFLEYLIAELTSRSLVPGTICFEITETAAIANLGNVVYFMRELKARGCHFALDDFGSGLSSFMYLKTLPVDYLKIDGQFIQNVACDPVDRSMVEAIGQVGRAMGIQTIAERVESEAVLLALARLGIGYAQGFYMAAPRTISAFPYLLRP
jgi:diguanylate cyclase (GGDEF)-like protein/PAS domain S-box-containing protein